jgi:hypothetical protein
VLLEPASAITDLLLGLAALGLWRSLRRRGASWAWRATFASIGASALLGAAYHAWVGADAAWSQAGWAPVGALLVLGLGFLLVASAQDTGVGRWTWALPAAGLVAYAALAVGGVAGVAALGVAASPTMLAVVVVWVRAARARHPLAPTALAAIAASALAGALVPMVAAVAPDVDGGAVYHVAQIPGLVLLYCVAVRRPLRVGRSELSAARRPSGGRRAVGDASREGATAGASDPRR